MKKTRTASVLALMAAVLAVAGCGSRLTEHQEEQICSALTIGGWSFAVSRASEMVDTADAADTVVAAVRARCPIWLDRIPAGART